MTWGSSKSYSSKTGAYPKTIVSWIFISVAGLVLLRSLVSWDLELNNTLTSSYSKSTSVPTYSKSTSVPTYSKSTSVPNATRIPSFDSDCDLYNGTWIHDPTIKPAYTEACPFMSSKLKCQANGRPDKEYLNWRWKPSQCDLPPFDGMQFLGLLSEKTIAFIGDSISRNFMESLLCTLQHVEDPVTGSNRRMKIYNFEKSFVKIVRIWSSRLINETHGDFSTDGVSKLHLDVPDQHFIDLIPQFDVIVLSSGPWFEKPAMKLLNNEVVRLNMTQAYGISVETVLTSIVTHPQYKGITILSSYSPKHFAGGDWNEGGTCSGNVMPIGVGELVENKDTNKAMHEAQVMGFNNAVKKKKNKSKLRLMDITQAFEYRRDGHPGCYNNPTKLTQPGPAGKPKPEDCLHWCMPGPIDTWNQFMLQILIDEIEGKQIVADVENFESEGKNS
ncbi:hypothetical protein ACLB2K_075068 [Fragaria x ananassa]